MFKTITAALLIAPMALAVAGLSSLAFGEKASAASCSAHLCSEMHMGQRYVWVK